MRWLRYTGTKGHVLTSSLRRSLVLAILSRIICWALTTLSRVPESITQHASPHSVGDPVSCWIFTCVSRAHRRQTCKPTGVDLHQEVHQLPFISFAHHLNQNIAGENEARQSMRDPYVP